MTKAAREVQGVVSVCPRLSPIIPFLCDLSYWCVWKLPRWDEPRLWPLKLLGGQSVCRHQLSPSASVSQQNPNLFGKQTPLLSLVSGGLLRVRSSLFSYWGRQGRSKENRRLRVRAGVKCSFMTGCYMTLEGVRALVHSNICICYTAQPLLPLLLWCCQMELQTDVGPGWIKFWCLNLMWSGCFFSIVYAQTKIIAGNVCVYLLYAWSFQRAITKTICACVSALTFILHICKLSGGEVLSRSVDGSSHACPVDLSVNTFLLNRIKTHFDQIINYMQTDRQSEINHLKKWIKEIDNESSTMSRRGAKTSGPLTAIPLAKKPASA